MSSATQSLQFKQVSTPNSPIDRSEQLADTVAWPINRCCYDELKPAELVVVENLFLTRDDSPLLMKWVILHKGASQFRKRLLVISSLRFWLLKRKRQPFKSTLVTSKENQLLYVHKVLVLRSTPSSISDQTTSIKLQINCPSKSEELTPSEEFHFDPGVHAEAITHLLQLLLHNLRLAFHNQIIPAVVFPPQWKNQPQTPSSPRPVAPEPPMTTAYRCFVDDLSIPYRQSVTTRLHECLESTSSVDFQYCLSATAGLNHSTLANKIGMFASIGHRLGLYRHWTSSIQCKEAHALARTLESGGVEHIVIADFRIGDRTLSTLFGTLLTPSCAIQAFTCTNINLSLPALRSLQHVLLEVSIQGRGAKLRRLDFSYNRFSVIMVHALAKILELLPPGLEILQLEQCHFGMFGSAHLLHAIKSCPSFSSGLRELNLSGNTLSIEGTRVLALWITGAFALQRLDLSRTRLKTNIFFQSFKQNSILHESSLVMLDLSYNRMGLQASIDLGEILGRTMSLSTLFLRGMKQKVFHPRRVFADTFGSQQHKKTHNRVTNRVTIINGLRKVHIKNIFGPMFQNMSRNTPSMIDLSENDLHGAKAMVLVQLLDQSPNAPRASIRLDHVHLTDKVAILLLHSLRGCATLDSLSLVGNGFRKRQTSESYKRFHIQCNKSLGATPEARIGANERAAGDALSLLLGGKATPPQDVNDNNSQGSSHSFTHLYHHKPKRLPLKELSLRAEGAYVFGPHVITAALYGLTTNTCLQVLDVSGNECGDALATALNVILPVNKTLQVLYWDDNFTTVEGLFLFYEGLLQNQTLTVVQLPINDTRRILEEQKDPPREKLFSVLGKIFKITERNQTLAQKCKREAPTRSHRTKSKENSDSRPSSPQSTAKGERKRSNRGNNQLEKDASIDTQNRLSDHVQKENESSDLKSDTTTEPTVNGDGEKGVSWDSFHQEHSPNTRYPSTMKSWSGSLSVKDVRASWDQMATMLR